MNILPKKRWHVRTKDNVARVRRDEAQAAAEEKSRLERSALAEQESRTRLLRERASLKKSADDGSAIYKPSTEDSKDPLGTESASGHVNFFAELEEQERTFGSSKEYENEKRLEKEAEERKIGLLKYLGEGSTEYMKETPWYKKLPDRKVVPDEKLNLVEIKGRNVTPIVNTPKASLDRKVSEKNSEIVFPSDIETKKRKRNKRHKNKKSKKRRHHSDDDSSSDSERVSAEEAETVSVDLEKLRAERLMREKQERLKTEQLLRPEKYKDTLKKTNEPHYEQKYSSQFNPGLARQNRN